VPQGSGFDDLKRRLSVMGLLLFYFIMIFNVIALFYAIFLVPGEIMNAHIHPLMFLIPFPPFLIGLDFSITGYAAVIYFLLLVAAILVSIETIIIREGRSFFRLGSKLLSVNKLTPEEEKRYDENGFVLLGELFMAVLFFNVCFIIALLLFGIETESPDFDEWHTWELMYGLARASVWEEVVSRIAFVGVPLMLIYLVNGKPLDCDEGEAAGKDPRECYHYLMGGELSITPLTAVLIFLSSLLFGLAHMSSWDAFKVFPTLVGGLALGYLFVKKGVHVSILLHFAIDYLSVLPGAIDSDVAILLEVVIGLIILILLSLGAYTFYKYSSRFMQFSFAMFIGTSAPAGSRGPGNEFPNFVSVGVPEYNNDPWRSNNEGWGEPAGLDGLQAMRDGSNEGRSEERRVREGGKEQESNIDHDDGQVMSDEGGQKKNVGLEGAQVISFEEEQKTNIGLEGAQVSGDGDEQETDTTVENRHEEGSGEEPATTAKADDRGDSGSAEEDRRN